MEDKKKGGVDPEEPLGVRQWITKTILLVIFLLVLVAVIDVYLPYPILTDTIIAFTLVLCIGFSHEALHFMTAMKLGYKPKWYRTRFKMGFEIVPHTNRKKWMNDKKVIALKPYIVLVPFSCIILAVGLLFNHLGLVIGAIGSLLMHGISYPTEGREIA